MLQSVPANQALQQLDRYSDIIDARSESEFALDRLPVGNGLDRLLGLLALGAQEGRLERAA